MSGLSIAPGVHCAELVGLAPVDGYDLSSYESYLMTDETVVTSKGASTIPRAIRTKAGQWDGSISVAGISRTTADA